MAESDNISADEHDDDETRMRVSPIESGDELTVFDSETRHAPVDETVEEAASPKLPMLGDYILLSKIGEGGMGRVFKARDSKMDRIVALKLLSSKLMKNEEAVRRFLQEVKAAAQLFHPNIVTALHTGEHQGMQFLVMEYVDGRPLSNIIREHGTIKLDQTVDYISQAAKGLAYAHGREMVHRDIKPSNFMLDGHGQVKLLDMGTARLGQKTDEDLTKSGVIMGTVNYMSPEQAKDPHSVDLRTDVYSLGCTMFYMLTGRPVYKGDMITTLMAHANNEIPSISEANPDIPPWVEQVFEKMVAKDPDDRYQNMEEVVADLADLQKEYGDEEAGGFFSGLRAPGRVQTFPVGIDIGTSGTRIAWSNTKGVPHMVATHDGKVETPSAVAIDGHMNSAVGDPALSRLGDRSVPMAFRLKKHLGSTYYPSPLGDESYHPEVLAGLLIAKAVMDAERTISTVKRAVIGVPSFFGERGLQAIQNAGAIAGLETVDVVAEPVAAASYFYQQDGVERTGKDLVVDLGAGKLDVVAIEHSKENSMVKASGGSSSIGGNAFDQQIVDMVADGLKSGYGVDPRENERECIMLWQGCEFAKRELTEKEQAAIRLQVGAQTIKAQLTRNKFESLCEPLLKRCGELIEDVLQRAKWTGSDVDRVLLCGGASQMPMFESMLSDVVGEASVVRLDENAVTLGATIHAEYRRAMQQGDEVPYKWVLVTGRTLSIVGTNVKDDKPVAVRLIPLNTSIPIRARKVFNTFQDNQRSFEFHLIEGESSDPAECVNLGKCLYTGIPEGTKAKTAINVQFRLDRNGRLSVSFGMNEDEKPVPVPLVRDLGMSGADIFKWKEWVETVMLCSGM
ncbi:MAG: Hsp70 family protein [Pirellulaceae bacterium]